MNKMTLKCVLAVFLLPALAVMLCGCAVTIDTGKTQSASAPSATSAAATEPEATSTPAASTSPAPAASSTPTLVPTPAATPAPTTDSTTEAGQIELIYSNLSALSSDDEYTKYWYTVTDLDHNGRLELLSAVTQGTGSFTSGRFFEVSENYNGFSEINLGLQEGYYLPEIILSSTDCYKAGDGTCSYMYTDTSSNGYGAVISAKVSMNLKNGYVTLNTIYIDTVTTENGYSVHDFKDGTGAAVSYETFGKLEENAFSGQTKSTANFDWFALSSASSADRLAESYSKFAGKTVALTRSSAPAAPITTVSPAAAPAKTASPAVSTAVPTPVTTPVPTQEIIVVRTPSVTKDPTGESLEAGKSCTFIARATDYSYMRWQLIDTYGNVYDALTNNPYPQMSIWGADSQQLTLSNVPLGMNGWSVRAAFTGTGTVYTKSAGIWVKEPKVSTPITAYPGNGSFFYDLYNAVTLYAGTGDQIHYELIRGGDTGAYESGTVTSGQSVYVIGIEGQYLDVELYASVIGDESNSLHAVYTVDRYPTEPTPEPYIPVPEPQYNSCAGEIIDEMMSSVVIDIFAGSTIQVLKDYISPQGCDLLGHSCTVYYYGVDPTNVDNVYAVEVY